MRLNAVLAALAGAGVVTGGAVHAAQITQTILVPSQLTDFSSVAFSSAIGLFDAGVGTLTDVVLGLSSTGTATGTVRNTGSSTVTIGWDLAITNSISAGPVSGTNGSGAQAQGVVLGQFSGSRKLDFGTASYTLAPNATGSYPDPASNSPATETSMATLTDPASLSAFTGAGMFSLAASATESESSSGGGGNSTMTDTTEAADSLTVTYDYTPATPTAVPEPASLACLGAGLLGVWCARRKRA